MTEHGITTTKADMWVHYHPLHREAAHQGYVFWYCADTMRRFIEREKLQPIKAKSKNGIVTGYGYLIPKGAWLVHRRQVIPQSCSTQINWFDLTDREVAMRGEEIVRDMLLFGYQVLPLNRVERIASPTEQLDGYDLRCTPSPTWLVEVKTEIMITDNLFVQVSEHNHQHNVCRSGERRASRLE